ncbi:hypothetical protein MPSEU_000276900 [Mayamaea pseudoterrestris]|nr:hypothetical protein MPSEU_000276900 [Mayamaea pseudoterrestris]
MTRLRPVAHLAIYVFVLCVQGTCCSAFSLHIHNAPNLRRQSSSTTRLYQASESATSFDKGDAISDERLLDEELANTIESVYDGLSLDQLSESFAANVSYFYLRDELQLPDETLWRITYEAESALGMTAATIRNKIDCLKTSLDMSDEDIRLIIGKQPTILHLSAEKNIATTILFLVRALDMGKSELRSIVCAVPAVLCYSKDNLKSKINFFIDVMGFTTAEARSLFLLEPNLLRAGVISGLMPHLRFLKLDLMISDDSVLRCIVQKQPRILLYSLDANLVPKLIVYCISMLGMSASQVEKLLLAYPEFLGYDLELHILPITNQFIQDLDMSAYEFSVLILKFPRVISYSLSKIKRILGYLRYEIGLVGLDLKRVVNAWPPIFALSQANLEGKVHSLRQAFVLSPEELQRVLVTKPTLLRYNFEKSLQPKIDYLRYSFGGDNALLREAIIKLPTLLGYSLDKRIKPRMEAMLYHEIDPRRITVALPMRDEYFTSWLNRQSGRNKWIQSAIVLYNPKDEARIMHWTRSRKGRESTSSGTGTLAGGSIEIIVSRAASTCATSFTITSDNRTLSSASDARGVQVAGSKFQSLMPSLMNMSQQDLQVEVVFSRPAFRQGGTLVGSVRVTRDDTNNASIIPPRNLIKSLDFCVMGRCRLDPRWHNVKEYQDAQLVAKKSLIWGMDHDKNSVCFWATQPIDLMEYQERTVGRWDDVKPKPILLEEGDETNVSVAEEISLEDHQLAFTFQANLPVSLPHSMQGTSCRYYYAVVIKLLLRSQKNARWIQTPFLVLTKHPDFDHIADDDSASLRKFRLAPCQAVVHSSGLPCFVTAAELHHPGGTLTVNQHGASQFSNVRRDDPKHLQTMRVADPSGEPVCILTLLGASVMHPGSRVKLTFDFPLTKDWVPCHQVCACLQGEEIAIRRDGSCKRSRSYLFSTAHEYFDPKCIERVTLELLLPLDAPCSIKTDVVAISIRCLVDISVEQPGKEGDFQNLRLEIPCEVTHSVAAYERTDDDARLRDNLSIDELLGDGNGEQLDKDPTNPASFQNVGISEELKILSMHMAESCGLRPRPSRQFEI